MTATDHFERLHREHRDPWNVRTSWYEQRKRDLLLAALPRARYAHGFEPGCSIGVLSRALAARCDRLLVADRSPSAVAAARRELGDLPHVEVRQADATRAWPEDDPFDLVVLSEWCSYVTPNELGTVLRRLVASTRPGGTVAACHWTHPAPDHRQSGDQVHDQILATPELAHVASHRERDFRLDVLTVGVVPSAAQLEGRAP